MNKYTYFIGFLFLNLYAINSHAVVVKVINNAPMTIAAIPVVYTSNGLTYMPDLVFTIPSTKPPVGFVGNYIATPGEVNIDKKSLERIIFVEAQYLPGVLANLQGALNTLAKASSYTAPKGAWDAALLTQIQWDMGDTLKNVSGPSSTLALISDKAATIRSITFTVDYGMAVSDAQLADAISSRFGRPATPQDIADLRAFTKDYPKLKVWETSRE